MVLEVDVSAVVHLIGKAKVPEAIVVYYGDRLSATQYVLDRKPGAAVAGACIETGHKGYSLTGDYGKSIAGDHGSAKTGDRGSAVTGDYGNSQAGDWGSAKSGDLGASIAEDFGRAQAGDRGSADVGYHGTAWAGYLGRVRAGKYGKLSIVWHDNNEVKLATCYVGDVGILANVWYRLGAHGRFVPFRG